VIPPPRPRGAGIGTLPQIRSGAENFRRADSLRPRMLKCPWEPGERPRSPGAADADVKSILETLEKDCGAVLR